MSYYRRDEVRIRLRKLKYLYGARRDRSTPRCYLGGPMTGLPEFNLHAFNTVAGIIRSVGWEVFNPVEGDAEKGIVLDGTQGNETFDFRGAMATDLAYIAEHADVVWFMPGWEESKGAQLEHYVATDLGIPCYSYPGMRRI